MKLDSSTYYGSLGGYITPWNAPCTSDADCQAAHQHGLTSMCNDAAYPPGGCTPGFQNWAVDNTLQMDLPACSVATKDFACGSTLIFSPPVVDPGVPAYGATVVYEVSADAKGTVTIEFDVANTWIKDPNNVAIPMVGHVPGRISVLTGQCCNTSTFECLADDVTVNECTDLGGNTWDPNKTCDDPCACATNSDCDDGDACTVDICNPDGTCSNLAKDCDDGLACTVDLCDPATPGDWPVNGCYYEAVDCDDGFGCTVDTCVEPNGCQNTKIDCSDDDPCSVDRCLEPDGTCENTQLDQGLPHQYVCPSGVVQDDCLGTVDQYTGEMVATTCVDGFCRCSVCDPTLPCDNPLACRADLVFEIGASDKPNANCFAKGEKVTVDVVKYAGGFPVPAAIPISAAQFLMSYDPSCVEFQSINPVDLPFVIDMWVDEVAGEIFYAVGVNPFGGEGPGGRAVLAQLTFTKASGCTNCNFDFGDAKLEHTFLADMEGQPICADVVKSKEISENDKLSLVVPDDVKVNVDCDAATAVVEWDAPSAFGSCDDPNCDPQQADKCYGVNVDCWGYGPDGQDLTHLAMGGGVFPQGQSTFGCTATSKICGDSIDDGWTVTVNSMATLDVEVQLEPVIAGDVIRCINFEVYADCVQDPVLIQAELPFGGKWNFVGHFSGELKVPKGANYVCITAMDQLHSLRAVADMVCADGVYTAEFKGDPKYFGGNWLTGGNLDAWKKENPNASHDKIDILDFGQFVASFLDQMDPNTTCDMKHAGPHADINGDGVVNGLDFAYIMRNFLQHSKGSCCPDGIGGLDAGRSEVSVRELEQMGMRDLTVADLNGDGLVNTDDMAAFLGGAAPQPTKTQDRTPRGLR